MRKYCFLFLLFCLTGFYNHSIASHAAGGEIYYEKVQGDTYRIIAKFFRFRDAHSLDAPSQLTIYIQSADPSVSHHRVADSTFIGEVDFICPGSDYVVEEYHYIIDTITLAKSRNWRIFYSVNARNGEITTLVNTSVNIFIEATLNNLDVSASEPHVSPEFQTSPIFQGCVGLSLDYSHNAVDLDGDQLIYSIVSPKISATQNVEYKTNYSFNNPFGLSSNLTLNSTGGFSLIPSHSLVTVMAVRVAEVRNGVEIGSVSRDIQINVHSVCNNNIPYSKGINDTEAFSVTANPGENISFNIKGYDDDSEPVVFMTWNNAIEGATFEIIDGQMEAIGTFSWTVPSNAVLGSSYCFEVTVRDQFCPMNGVRIYPVCILIGGTPPPCNDCITSFSPLRGETYVLSTWVKEESTNATTFDNCGIYIEFEGAPDVIGPIYPDPDHPIIDGWQRVEHAFPIPATATKIKMRIVNKSPSIAAFVDDIRIHPFNSNMKSYVYDPETFRLMAELDERNYATFYEYDEEGALIRVKKETERGIMTIQESRNNTVKGQ